MTVRIVSSCCECLSLRSDGFEPRAAPVPFPSYWWGCCAACNALRPFLVLGSLVYHTAPAEAPPDDRPW